ncbi:putative sphingolipid transporter spinster homolog 2 [Zea mays]|uniref:Putative sphingolipid transporter spinster homolog 2 n=1 Tax=Zea mays TaxID=4577 RepID=A0A1D6E5R1_MAIZE|nr:putative sphingolipid transporter spinster homolog 2 [Zea mays]
MGVRVLKKADGAANKSCSHHLWEGYNPFRLIGVGLLVWTIATAGCGVSFDFWSITICRMFVGVGEASFISLAAPFIDDNAPVAQKTAWLGMFYMCIPTGIALGYVYGGLVGKYLNWRAAFWGESILMVPFVILGFAHNTTKEYGQMLNPEVQDQINNNATKHVLPGGIEDLSGKVPQKFSLSSFCHGIMTEIGRFSKDMKELLQEKVFVIVVLGYISYNFVIGAYSYWGPKAGQEIYNMSLYGFIPSFAVGELSVFATQAPVNFVCLHAVKPHLRPLAMAVSTVSIHIFGDVPSSPLVGLLQDKINNWRATALILTSILFAAVVFWFIGIFIPSVDRFNEESEHGLTVAERSNLRPLLDEKDEPRTSD